jgi:hypothetical protein
MSVCSCCGIDKPATEFYPRYRKCKTCLLPPHRRLPRICNGCSGAVVPLRRRFCDACRVVRLAKRNHRYFVQHRGQIVSRNAEYYRSNRADCLRQQRAYYHSNPEPRKQTAAKWAAAHPDKCREHQRKYGRKVAAEVTAAYARGQIAHAGIPARLIPDALVQAVQLSIKIKRHIKEKRNGSA